MYVRKVQGKTLEFGHQGWLLDESFLFYDREYGSLWVQATGECLTGRFKGEKLEAVPATHATWGQWRSLHPETLVLEKPSYLAQQYRRDSYEELHRSRGSAFGLGVFVGGDQKLYPFAELEHQPVVHDLVGEETVLVVFHAPTQTAVAFEPMVGEQRLEFELAEVTPTDLVLRDPRTGSTWSGLSGRRTGAETSEPALRQLRSTPFVVANWLKHFPDSAVFQSGPDTR